MSICAGSDRNLWFVDGSESRIGRITTSGKITYFSISPAGAPTSISCGADGAIWVISENRIVKLDSSSGATKQIDVPSNSPGLEDITSGPDGAVWFTEKSGHIGRVTSEGEIKEFTPPWKSSPSSLTTGSDGNIWFTDNALPGLGAYLIRGVSGEIARKAKSTYQSGWMSARLDYNGLGDIVAAPDGNFILPKRTE